MTSVTTAPTGPNTADPPAQNEGDTVVDTRTWQQKTADAARNRARNAALRADMDVRSTEFRNRRQHWPWQFTGATAALGGLGAAAAQSPEVETLAAAGGTSAVAAAGAVGAWFWLRERVGQWRTRVQLGLAGGAGWASVAPLVETPQGWAGMGLALGLGTVGLSMGYWQHHRPGYPTGPVPESAPDPEESPQGDSDALPEIIANWNRNVAAKGGPLEGARISDLGAISNGESYRVTLVPAKQTLGTAQAKHEAIAGGLHMNPQKVLIEAAAPADGEDEDPNDLELRVVRRSPINKTVYFEQPSYRVNDAGVGFVELGPYADGEGHDAGYALYGPNSMFNGFGVGGTGSGKTKMTETIGLTSLSDEAPPTVIVYLDGQSGDSSASLWEHALWRGGPDKARTIASSLLEMMSYRGKYIQWRRRTQNGGGFAPIPTMPGILVLIDECHAIYEQAGDLFAVLAREGRKNGFGQYATSQTVDLTVFGKGGDALRSSLVAGNGIGLRTDSGVQSTVFPGLNADLQQLPPGGYGYTSPGKDGQHRTAQFRNRFLLDQGDKAKLDEADVTVPGTVRLVEDWFTELAPRQELSEDMGRIAGDAFLQRAEDAAEEDAALDEIFGNDGDPVELFQNRRGKVSSPSKAKATRDSDAAEGSNVTPLFSGGFGDLTEPTPPPSVPARDLKPREQQLVDLLTGYEELSVQQLAEEMAISEQSVRSWIRGLGETWLVQSATGRGIYRLARPVQD